ncbi:hypothetical protein KUV95_00350 [Microbulbifer agarilyticus]|uniref:hypothetical protein n=1 Tax=Microbulbifer agarilyticus TaxID=260552 RepID=UPI001C95FDE2|nr:hypothetical protein [Microbulbifer agarilyticus]MBY6209993.1 hypothetical protein [Microbulbifer agarilyticus]
MSVRGFRVVFTGNLCDGISRREGISRLSKMLGLEFDDINRLLSVHNPTVKRFGMKAEADRLVKLFRGAGWSAEVIQSSSGSTCVNSEDKTPQYTDSTKVLKNETSQIAASDGSCSLKVPFPWQRLCGLNRRAVIQVGNLNENTFHVVLSKPVQSIDSSAALENYCCRQLRHCAEQVHCGEIRRAVTSLRRAGFNGFVGELAAEIDQVRVRYLVACSSEGGRVFTQVAWCESEDFDRNRERLLGVVSSLDVVNTQAQRDVNLRPMSRATSPTVLQHRRRMRA